MPVREGQEETVFLRELIAYDDSAERRQLDERMSQAQRDRRCVRRAVVVMTLLVALAVVGLGYAAVLRPQHLLNLPRFVSQPVVKVICVLGLTGLLCTFAFLVLEAVYRSRLRGLCEESRRFAARVVRSRLGSATTSDQADRVDGEDRRSPEAPSPMKSVESWSGTNQLERMGGSSG